MVSFLPLICGCFVVSECFYGDHLVGVGNYDWASCLVIFDHFYKVHAICL